jgi:DNA mismatch endonuclease (patch repair protein)
MQATRTRDNKLELGLRSALHRMGFRFRVHKRLLKGLTRSVDLAFSRSRIAVFVDGCFWHGCPIHMTWPKTNAEWWREKIQANRCRDADTDARLVAEGWTVVRIWEHETTEAAAERLAELLRVRSSKVSATAKPNRRSE